jgi:viroplasmin and RNaseH domain-containing protein
MLYAVSNGRNIGIFLNWNDCNNSVKGYKNALYKNRHLPKALTRKGVIDVKGIKGIKKLMHVN